MVDSQFDSLCGGPRPIATDPSKWQEQPGVTTGQLQRREISVQENTHSVSIAPPGALLVHSSNLWTVRRTDQECSLSLIAVPIHYQDGWFLSRSGPGQGIRMLQSAPSYSDLGPAARGLILCQLSGYNCYVLIFLVFSFLIFVYFLTILWGYILS